MDDDRMTIDMTSGWSAVQVHNGMLRDLKNPSFPSRASCSVGSLTISLFADVIYSRGSLRASRIVTARESRMPQEVLQASALGNVIVQQELNDLQIIGPANRLDSMSHLEPKEQCQCTAYCN